MAKRYLQRLGLYILFIIICIALFPLVLNLLNWSIHLLAFSLRIFFDILGVIILGGASIVMFAAILITNWHDIKKDQDEDLVTNKK